MASSAQPYIINQARLHTERFVRLTALSHAMETGNALQASPMQAQQCAQSPATCAIAIILCTMLRTDNMSAPTSDIRRGNT